MYLVAILQFLITASYIFVLGFVPGYLVLRRFNLRDDERIAASFGVSFIILYFIGFVLFLLNETSTKLFYLVYIALILTLLCLYLHRTEIFNKFRDCFLNSNYPKLKRSLKIENFNLLTLSFIIFLYTAFFESLIRSLFYFYTTGFDGNDWLPFFGVSQFYSSQMSIDIAYSTINRTPLYYIVNGFFLSIFGNSFWVYQIGNSILTAPFFLSLYLLSKKLFGNKEEYSKIGIVAVLFILLNPYFFKNIIYPTSKILTAYFIIMSVYFYLKLRESSFDSKLKIDFFLCGLFAGAAYMSHQLGLLYIAGMAIDYLFLIRYRIIKFSIKPWAFGIIISSGLIASWYLWAIDAYGLKHVLSSNPPIFKTTFFFWIYSRLHDLFTSFVPIELIYYIYAGITGIFRSFDKLFDSTLSFYFHTVFGALSITLTAFLLYKLKTEGANIKTAIADIFNRTKKSYASAHVCIGILIFVGFTGGLLTVPAAALYNHGIATASFVPLLPFIIIYLIKYAYDSPRGLRSLIFFGIVAEFLITTWSQLLITNFDLKLLPVPGEKSFSIIRGLDSGNVFLGDYLIISLVAVILIQLFFILNFHRLFVKRDEI